MNHYAVEVINNLRFTLEAIAALKTSRSIFFREKGSAFEGLALATGTNSSSENWAFFPSGIVDTKNIERVCSFFKDQSLPFIWPLFPEAASDMRILEEAGMISRGELLAMTRSTTLYEKNNILSSLSFEINKKTDLWAETAWTAFDSQLGAPASFVKLAQGLRDSDGFFLILAKRDGIPAGTAMLVLSGGSAGLYYFATLPKERRKGIGNAMLYEAARISKERGKSVFTLQATPGGASFYASRGFRPLFGLPLYSFSEEVF